MSGGSVYSMINMKVKYLWQSVHQGNVTNFIHFKVTIKAAIY